MNRKILTNKTVKYLREVSVVVIGVTITLWATLWINQKNEKKDMSLHLNAIKMELEENIKEINNAVKYYRLEVEYSNYLQMHDRKSLNEDSLVYYTNACCCRNLLFSFKTTAFEMFKTSGIMRLMGDKELMLLLWNEYDGLSSLKGIFDVQSQMKREAMEKEIPTLMLLRRDGKFNTKDLINTPTMQRFYIFNIFTSTVNYCEYMSDTTKELIEMLEKYNKE